MIEIYGIESGRQLIINDAKQVFEMYGIPVDNRHLSLIADYMTFSGNYLPCNRYSMNFKSGPFQKMTFEQSTHFITTSSLNHENDDITGPSSRIVFGRNIEQGTGSFDLFSDLKYHPKKFKL
jgi:DNA-directed RNA polymerase I subunit RPA1